MAITSLIIEDKEWNKYSKKVQDEFGNREKGNVLIILIKAYNRGLIDAKQLEEQMKEK